MEQAETSAQAKARGPNSVSVPFLFFAYVFQYMVCNMALCALLEDHELMGHIEGQEEFVVYCPFLTLDWLRYCTLLHCMFDKVA